MNQIRQAPKVTEKILAGMHIITKCLKLQFTIVKISRKSQFLKSI